MMLLHGEQELRLNGALPVEGTITTKPKIGGIYDKVKVRLIISCAAVECCAYARQSRARS